jgi:hypothetical protein
MTGIDCWTPGLILRNLEAGYAVPADWRERLTAAGYQIPDTPPARVECDGQLDLWGDQ